MCGKRAMAGMAVATVLLVVSTGGASLMNDVNGMATWQGKQHFQSATVTYVNLDVEYSVYAPGQFTKSFDITDPSGGTHYFYAYQLNNNYVPKGLADYITMFSVGFSDGVPGGDRSDEQVANIGFYDGAGKNPNENHFGPDSAVWTYLTSAFPYGQVSDVLYYSSPFGPELDTATVTGKSGKGNTQLLPSPTPEPSTLIILTFGLFAACSRRRSRV